MNQLLPPTPDQDQSRSQFMQWLQEAQQGSGDEEVRTADMSTVEAIPVGDPQQVRELSPSILGCYQVVDGHSELSGCTLEPRPLLRVTSEVDAGHVHHRWFGGDGQPLAADLIERLGLTDLAPCEERLRASDAPVVRHWIDAALQGQAVDASEQGGGSSVDGGALPWLAATIVWCRWASGAVAFRFGNGAEGRCNFAGWAIDFVQGYQRPEKFRCAASGEESFEVLALADGTVTVPQAVARCEATGTLTLISKLKTCEVSGSRVLGDLLVQCPISGLWALPDRLETCAWCGRQVVAGRIDQQLCSDCRGGQAIDSDDALLAGLIADNRGLSRYGHWRGWRDGAVAVLVGRRWLGGQIAIVYDRQQNQIRQTARRGRFGQRWTV